jgi:hypothetical protein
MAQKVLAIESAKRPGEELIDALPYIDPLTPDIKKQVESLIEAEMRNSTKRPADYLKELPALPPAKFEGHPLLLQEYERCVAPRRTAAPCAASSPPMLCSHAHIVVPECLGCVSGRQHCAAAALDPVERHSNPSMLITTQGARAAADAAFGHHAV